MMRREAREGLWRVGGQGRQDVQRRCEQREGLTLPRAGRCA